VLKIKLFKNKIRIIAGVDFRLYLFLFFGYFKFILTNLIINLSSIFFSNYLKNRNYNKKLLIHNIKVSYVKLYLI
jgi:hypothetical protein